MWEKAYEILKLILNCGFELLDNNYHLQAQEIKHYSDLCKDYPIEVNNEIIGYLAVNERESRGESIEIQNAIKIFEKFFKNLLTNRTECAIIIMSRGADRNYYK